MLRWTRLSGPHRGGHFQQTQNAYGLERAKKAGIATSVINHRDYDDRESFEEAIDQELKKYKAKFICLAGFMRILDARFVNRWKDRILNIHPSLLPAFRGLHTQERALESGVRFTGCTVTYRPAGNGRRPDHLAGGPGR